jgi:hypothetical protein
MALWIMSMVVIGVWEVFAAEQGSREVHRNAVVVSVTTQADDAGVQVRTLVVSIPEKHDELTFAIPASNKELFDAVGTLQKGDKIVVALIVGNGKSQLRAFAKAK